MLKLGAWSSATAQANLTPMYIHKTHSAEHTRLPQRLGCAHCRLATFEWSKILFDSLLGILANVDRLRVRF